MHTVNLKQKGPKKRVATRVVIEVLNGRLVNKWRFEYGYFTLKWLLCGNFHLSTIFFNNVEMSPPSTQVCQSYESVTIYRRKLEEPLSLLYYSIMCVYWLHQRLKGLNRAHENCHKFLTSNKCVEIRAQKVNLLNTPICFPFFFFFLRVTCLVLLSLYDGMLVWLSSVLNLACKQALYLGHSREVTREPDLIGDASVLSRSLVWACSQAILNGKFHFFHLRTHFKQMSCLRNARRKYILLQHHIL